MQPISQHAHMHEPLALHIGIKYGHGGEGRVFSELTNHLPAEGIRILGVVGGPEDVSKTTGNKISSFAPAGASMARRLIGVRRSVATILESAKPDLICSHFALYTAPSLDLIGNLPLVSHFHGPWAAESKQEGGGSISAFMKSRVEELVYSKSNRVIVLSKAFSELVTTRYGISSELVRIVPGSVDIARFHVTVSRNEARSKLGLPLDRPLLLSVRRLVQRMGLSNLIAAMKIISAKVPDVLLCIGGEGPLRSDLERQVQELGLTQHVRFLGYIEEEALPTLYRAADINVVPTLSLEGFGLVAAEALAAGTPSMVTPVGGLPEIVFPLSPSLVFASCSANDLAEGLVSALLGNLQLPDQDTCELYVAEHFSSSSMAARTASVYQELLM